jgi:hypothetical protein
MLFVLLLSSLVLSAGFPPFASGQDQFVGNVKLVESKDPAQNPRIVRIGYSALITAKPGDAVFLGDTVKTGDDVRAQIQLSDGSIVIVAPNSIVQMKGYLVDREQGTRNSVMKALKGTIRFMISKVFRPYAAGSEMNWKESNVTIETQNTVAGVRGTDFVVTSGKDESEIAVFDGAVSVKSSSLSVNGGVMVGSGEVSTVAKGKSPSAPAPLSAERKAALEGLTTLTNPRTTANGDPVKKPLKYSDKDIARDLAAGLSLGAVMDKAVESGMPIEQTVTAMLDAGVNPSVVVYTAIVEGYSAKLVVAASVEHGAPLSVVAAAALGAGADKKDIIAGARDAGVPPAAIAAAIANGTAPGGPVFGTPLPFEPKPDSTPLIGGGGGGTPSTQPASPYKP